MFYSTYRYLVGLNKIDNILIQLNLRPCCVLYLFYVSVRVAFDWIWKKTTQTEIRKWHHFSSEISPAPSIFAEGAVNDCFNQSLWFYLTFLFYYYYFIQHGYIIFLLWPFFFQYYSKSVILFDLLNVLEWMNEWLWFPGLPGRFMLIGRASQYVVWFFFLRFVSYGSKFLLGLGDFLV